MQRFDTKIASVTKASPRVKIFKIEMPDGFDFVPGQFVKVSVPGFENENGLPIKRPYSIASSPLKKGHIELCISMVISGKLSGRMSQMHRGDDVTIEGPCGKFGLAKPVPEKSVFIAGGTGISPLISMLRTLYLENYSKPLRLYYGIRSEKEFLYREELESYGKNNLLELTVVASEDNDWSGEKGHVSDIVGKHLSLQQTPVYVCGPPVMVRATEEKLKEKGFEDEQLMKEQW